MNEINNHQLIERSLLENINKDFNKFTVSLGIGLVSLSIFYIINNLINLYLKNKIFYLKKKELESLENNKEEKEKWLLKNRDSCNKMGEYLKKKYVEIKKEYEEKQYDNNKDFFILYINSNDKPENEIILIYLVNIAKEDDEIKKLSWLSSNNEPETLLCSRLLWNEAINLECNEFFRWINIERDKIKLHPENNYLYKKHKENIEKFKKSLKEIREKIEKNEEIDNTYEKYQEILSRNNNIIIFILANELKIDINLQECECFIIDEISLLKSAYNKEKELRRICPERCIIYKANKEEINKFYTYMESFIIQIKKYETINKEYNDLYNEMYNIQKNINQKNESERLELFFHHISQLLNIHYNIEYGMLKYEMLSIENQRKLNKYYNIIKEEALLRSSYREREYQWYINENTLKETINNINNIIELFDNCNQEEDEKLYLNYMMHANATESEKIRLLFSEKFNEERIDYNQLMYHIKLNELKKKIEIQTNLRLKKIDETNSYYYKNHKDAIEVCMEKICELNKIMNEATDISLFNIFYDLLKKELAMENLSHISDELFIETIFKIYSYKSKIIKKYSIYYLLPRNSRDLISNLKIHCMREYELRKNTPSRGLSNNFLQDLLKFRNWLQYNIIAILEGNCINEKKKIIDLLGSTVRTYQKTMLYDIFLKKWANANANENKNIPSILISYLDIADKERIDCVKELLKTVYEELLNNEKELNEIKRLQDNTNHISTYAV